MSNRHIFRSIVLQSLFEWDFKKSDEQQALRALSRNIKEFSPETEDTNFMESLLKGVLSKIKDLDGIISKAAPDWPIDKISIVDRNILRIGLYELLFADGKDVPPRVAINEAIELAKTFGGENSGKFVNGVLGTIYREMGEPEMEDKEKKKKPKKDSSKNVPSEYLSGALVYSRYNGDFYVALVHDIFGHWTLSKGKIQESEDEKTGAIREIKEELGIDINPEESIGLNQYIAYDPEKGKIKKIVKYFLASAPFTDLKLGESGGLDDAKWFKLKDILDLNFYDDIMPIITKAINILAEKANSH